MYLALEFSFPTGVEDCYSALKWVYANANNLRIDANRITVVGDSAGGAPAAAVTQMARDRKHFPVCFQMLCYPVTDSRQITKSVEMFIDTPIWNSPRNAMIWNVYLRNGDNGICFTNARKSFKNLPRVYVEVAEFDPLRDEGKNYADALKENGIEVEFVQTNKNVL
ncbi:alpha/beta hydrolase [Clostridium estertheticum]|uniref:alpha/beta hydrolase n=1 Tax=Clostridium estertheticum TaxID=238834 RepID=UPI001C0BB51D|nr:alpha/beta hydrolase [Clostridium estertheticum]MBU3214686.1 alpha/beta hydrolase [Clostridium estertheticum]WAG57920.1 alpha/beta hydrolase [Clostridium estertheticum]